MLCALLLCYVILLLLLIGSVVPAAGWLRGVDIGYMLFNSLVLACSIVALTLYHLATITALYRLYCCLGVLLATYYDKAPLKGAYLLVRLIFRVGIIIYLFLAWLVSNTKKDNGNYIRYPLIIY